MYSLPRSTLHLLTLWEAILELRGGGGGSRNMSGRFSYPCSPSKIRARFHSFKHTLLAPAMELLWDVLLTVNENKLRNGCRNAWQTILL
jgi:hypothetical protein